MFHIFIDSLELRSSDMKKQLLSLLLSATSMVGVSNAQTLVVSDLDNLVMGDPSTVLLTAHATVTNSGASDMDVLVEFNQIAGVQGAGHYFCWAVCYSEGQVSDGFQTPANHSVNIPAGQSVTNFYSDYVPHNTVGVATYEYCFFDKNDSSDKTCVQITFDTQNVGVEEVFQASGSAISESYPNPANNEAKINYSLKSDWETAEVTLYSMLGSKVKKIALKEKQGVLKMDVSTLPAGMYFYTLNVDGKNISTKKMLVTK